MSYLFYSNKRKYYRGIKWEWGWGGGGGGSLVAKIEMLQSKN